MGGQEADGVTHGFKVILRPSAGVNAAPGPVKALL